MDKGKVTDDDETSKHDVEKLVIFGPSRGRRIAQLKLMSAIETKSPGFFLDHKERWNVDNNYDGKLGMTHVKMTEGQFKYALGRRGTTRRKLERASGAIIEYIGYIAFISGTKDERRRGRDYINYLLDQREGETHIDNINNRDDVSVVECPEEYIGYITGHRGSELRSIEERTGTFCFMYGNDRGWWQGSRRQQESSWHHRHHHHHHSCYSRLLIFSFDRLRRDDAEEMVRDRIESKIRDDINKGMPIPVEFDNKHSNDDIENKRKEKWGERPEENILQERRDQDTSDALPRSVTPSTATNNKERSGSRKRSRSTEELEEERSMHGGSKSRERRHHTPSGDRSSSKSPNDSRSSSSCVDGKSHSRRRRSLSKESIGDKDEEEERGRRSHSRSNRRKKPRRHVGESRSRRSSRSSRSRSDSCRSRSRYSSGSPPLRRHHHHHHYRSESS